MTFFQPLCHPSLIGLIVLLLGGSAFVPSRATAQEMDEWERDYQRQQKVEEWFQEYKDAYGLSKPMLEVIREEFKDFYDHFGDALTVIDILDKFYNAQDWKTFETTVTEIEKKLFSIFYPTYSTIISWSGWAWTGMKVIKRLVFDPSLLQLGMDNYATARDMGLEPYAAIAHVRAWGNIRQQMLEKFKEEYGDLVFESTDPSGYVLQDRWEGRFQRFLVSHFEAEYQKRQFKALQEKAGQLKKQKEAERDEAVRKLQELVAEIQNRTKTLTITPASATLKLGETVTFTVTATTYSGKERDVTAEALPSSSFTATSSGRHIITATYGGTSEKTIIDVDPEPVRLSLTPQRPSVKPGEQVEFTATAEYYDGTHVDVTQQATWRGRGHTFTTNRPGTYVVAVSFAGLNAETQVTVEAVCEAHEVWSDADGRCVCADGYEYSDEVGACINLDAAIADATPDGAGSACDADAVRAKLARLDELAASGRRMAAEFQSTLNAFQQEINTQNANPCQNDIVAVAYSGAQASLAQYQALVDEATDLSTELILERSFCPELDVDVSTILGRVAGLGPPMGQIEDGIATMQQQLLTYGCDEQDVRDQGETVAERTDPELVQAGGTGATEACGDGIDNDGDGLIDEGCEEGDNFNVIVVLFDSGNLADDVFGLSVTGQGNLGTTPQGGSRTYPLRLAPGSYVATVTVITAPDNKGTFTIRVLEGDRDIAVQSGNPPQGSVITVPFTVSENASAAQTKSILPRMMNFERRIEQAEGGQR